MGGASIRIEDVCVDYPVKERGMRRVLNGIDLEIAGGEFVSIVGQTGCGKSTLLRLILGEEAPTRGRVLVNGQERHQPDRYLRLRAAEIFAVSRQDRAGQCHVRLGSNRVRTCLSAQSGAPHAKAQISRGSIALLAAYRAAGSGREQVSSPAFRRHAAARRDRSGADPETAGPAHGRSLQRARPGDPQRNAAADQGTCGARAEPPSCLSRTTRAKRSAWARASSRWPRTSPASTALPSLSTFPFRTWISIRTKTRSDRSSGRWNPPLSHARTPPGRRLRQSTIDQTCPFTNATRRVIANIPVRCPISRDLEGMRALKEEKEIPLRQWQEEVRRGKEFGLECVDSIEDKSEISCFQRGELPHWSGINTFLKTPI